MFNSSLNDVFLKIPFAVCEPVLLSLIYEYILDRKPMNFVIGIPDASSLNLPITFLLVL